MERVTMGLLHLGLLGVFVQPVVGGIVVIAAATLAWVLDASTSGAAFLVIAMGFVAWATRPAIRTGFAAGALTMLILEFALGRQWPTLIYSVVALLVMFAVGSNLRAGGLARATVRELRERTQAEVDAALAAERGHMARELHDIVAHELTIISMHTHVAVHPLTDDEGHREALERIREASRRALVDLRLMLSVLRHDSPLKAMPVPRPLSDELERLSQELANSGYEVSTKVERREAHRMVESCLVRVLQESTTNVIKHVGVGATVLIAVQSSAPDRLSLQVTNGPAPQPHSAPHPLSGTGLGLVGMQERVELLGGTLEASRTSDDGWQVTATLPLQPDSRLSSDIGSKSESPTQQTGCDVPQQQ